MARENRAAEAMLLGHISKNKTVVVLPAFSRHDVEKQEQPCRGIPMSPQEAGQNLQEDVSRVLKTRDVKYVVFVPDAGHSAAIRMSYGDLDTNAVVLDSGHFGETGMQVSRAGFGMKRDQIAAPCGFSWTDEIREMYGVHELSECYANRDGAKLVTGSIKAESPPRVPPPRDGHYIKNRSRASLSFQPI